MAIREKMKLSDIIIEDIKKQVEAGALKKGDKLPNQIEFAKQLGVSRLSLREALQKLQMMGVIEQKPKLGTVIVDDDVQKWNDNIVYTITDNRNNLHQLVEVRLMMEAYATKQICRTATPENLQDIEEILCLGEKAHRDGEMQDYIEYDLRFHHYIIDALDNKYIKNMYKTILGSISKYMKDLYFSLPEVWTDAPERHRQIFDVIRQGDTDRVEEVLEQAEKTEWDIFEKYLASI